MLKVYNSLTRRKEEFKPLKKGEVGMYSCGPTVYYYPHIGNMRAYLFMDTLARVIRFNGYKLKLVMNLTDVGHLTSDADSGEDKMEIAAKREGKDPWEISRFYTEKFFDAFAKLNIEKPNVVCKATDYIKEQIEMVEELEKKGYTYKIEGDGIYFDIKKFKEYGNLSGKDINKIGVARIDENENKRHSFDFALWKFVSPNTIMKWDSPWGVGCPGWHIECSAMSFKHLGKQFDIHTGGIDHLPIHHENEIAQSNCALGCRAVNVWMHCEFLQVDGGKMSKSLNNFYTIDDVINKGYNALDFRYFNLLTNYRKQINFTFEAMNSSKTARTNLIEILKKHKTSQDTTEKKILEKYLEDFKLAVSDDLNTPKGLGILWEMIKEQASKDIYETALKFDEVLGLRLKEECEKEEAKIEIPEEVIKLADARLKAKQEKDWKRADELRAEITKLGYNVKDTKEGYELC